MTTKSSEISSGLVVSIYLAFSDDGENIRFWTSNAFRAVEWAQENWETEAFVRLSDAEAIIAQKDAEILEQCRINGMGAERELALLGQIERQDERIKGLEEQAQSLARSVMCDQVSNDSHSLFLAAIRDLAAINECLGLDPDDGGAVPIIDAIEAQSAALKLAREALFDMQDSYAAVHGWKDSFVIAATTAIAAIDSLQKGE